MESLCNHCFVKPVDILFEFAIIKKSLPASDSDTYFQRIAIKSKRVTYGGPFQGVLG